MGQTFSGAHVNLNPVMASTSLLQNPRASTQDHCDWVDTGGGNYYCPNIEGPAPVDKRSNDLRDALPLCDGIPGANAACRAVALVVDKIDGDEDDATKQAEMLAVDTAVTAAWVATVGVAGPEADAAGAAARLSIEGLEGAELESALAAGPELPNVPAVGSVAMGGREVSLMLPMSLQVPGLIVQGANAVNSKLDANKQQVDNLKARLDAVARRDQALIDAAIAKRDADDRKKTPEKEQQRLDGYAALKDAATRRQEDATPAPITPAPHTDDAPVQVHNKPEVTMDPDLVPDAATPSAVVPQLDLRGPATIVLAGVVLYGAYSAYTLA
jgi:hypothetical protein